MRNIIKMDLYRMYKSSFTKLVLLLLILYSISSVITMKGNIAEYSKNADNESFREFWSGYNDNIYEVSINMEYDEQVLYGAKSTRFG